MSVWTVCYRHTHVNPHCTYTYLYNTCMCTVGAVADMCMHVRACWVRVTHSQQPPAHFSDAQPLPQPQPHQQWRMRSR